MLSKTGQILIFPPLSAVYDINIAYNLRFVNI